MANTEFTLVFETSTPHGSLALFENRHLIGLEFFHALRGHNSQIFSPLERLLALGKCRENGLHHIIVGIGPGSYTGIRVSIALANALSLSLGATIRGACSFLGAETDSSAYWVVGDARRDRFFRAEISGGRLERPIISEPRELWEAAVKTSLSAGEPVLTFDPHAHLPNIIESRPSASLLGQRVLKNKDCSSTTESLEPLYLSAPYITVPKKPGKRISPQSVRDFS